MSAQVGTGTGPGSLRTSASPISRIYGFGSLYAKTLRDSRLALIIVAGLLGILLISSGAAFGDAYATPQSRAELAAIVKALPPAMVGIYGSPSPVGVETLGGSIQWKTGAAMGLVAALWSILALSGTLVGEARRGSLDLVATTPLGLRRIALEKLGAHLTGMAIVVVVTALCAWLGGALFAKLPGDEISWAGAWGFGLWIGMVALASGSVAFALAPLIGRGAAAGIAGGITLFGYLANGYRDAVPAFDPIANLTWWGWTVNHQPLAGQLDWVSLIPGAVVAAALLAAGIAVFERRDLGVTTRIPWPSMPSLALGLGGPGSRSFGERLPGATWWGLGVAVLGFVMGAAAVSFSESLRQLSPATLAIFSGFLPEVDLLSGAGAFLQLAFVMFGFILAGFAAATLVSGWASDETGGRMELLLAAPISRVRWALLSGLGLYASIAVFTAIVMAGIGVGSVIAGGDVFTPVVGTLVIGLYALALAGVGVAVGGTLRASIAGEVVAGIVVLTFLVDFLVPALKLPDGIRQLALTAHLGQPMVGSWDWPGMVACLAIAAAGLLIGAWGLARRDVER